MAAWKWLVAWIVLPSTASAQFVPAPAQNGGGDAPASARAADDIPAPKPAVSRVAAVTVYRSNALVTREVDVPEGKGLVEVIVTPLPPGTLERSLFAEGTDGIRVLSTRFRTRAVKDDTRKDVRSKQDQLESLELEAKRIQREIAVQQENLQLLQKLEGFTEATLKTLSNKGHLNEKSTIELAKYVMDSRAAKSTTQVELEQKLRANAQAIEFAKRQLAELSAGSNRAEIDAVIVTDKTNAAPGHVRLSYLVGNATWRPQYRVRAGGEKDPVQVEYLAEIEQLSGEAWNDARLTLSTAQPTLSATLPELMPLNLAVAGQEPASEENDKPPSERESAGGMAGMGGRHGRHGRYGCDATACWGFVVPERGSERADRQ